MQVFVFLTCALLGVVSGAVYDVLYIARCAVCGVNVKAYTLKDRIFTAACDLVYFAALSAGYVFISVLFGFENFRLYMAAGCALGAILYLKSFHVIVAFFVKKVYNKLSKQKENENGRG